MLVPPEIVIPVDIISFGVAEFGKGVHVELSDEGGEVGVLEVAR
jgi:hypothetical protein